MSIISDQRIAHFDRPARLRDWPDLRRADHRAEVKRRRGGPSGNVSHELVMAKSRLWLAELRGEDVSALKARLDFMRRRERMLERKREERARARLARRPSVKSRINRARQQREYIRLHEEQSANWDAREDELA